MNEVDSRLITNFQSEEDVYNFYSKLDYYYLKLLVQTLLTPIIAGYEIEQLIQIYLNDESMDISRHALDHTQNNKEKSKLLDLLVKIIQNSKIIQTMTSLEDIKNLINN
jgi:hypothetical protein